MPRRMSVCSVSLGVLLALAAFVLSTRASSTEDALSKIKQRGELIVGTELQCVPFQFPQRHTAVGFDVNLINMIAKAWDAKVNGLDLPRAGVLAVLEGEEFDIVVASTTITTGRLQRYDMTLPIGDASIALVKLASDETITKPEDTRGEL